MRLPDPQRSCAVLIGTGTYRSAEIADLPAVANNLDGLARILTDPALGGFSADRCTVLPNPADTRAVYHALRRYAELAEDTLLVYFAGHGMTTPVRNELYLALTDTQPDALRVSALPFDLIREVLGEAPAVNRVVILDCCFSGRVTREFMSGADQAILGQLDIEGTYILASAPATSVALAPTGATYTAFTGELLTLLRTGVPGGPELLTFATIYRRLLHTMHARGLPAPEQRGTGTVDQLALTRNVAASRAAPDTNKDHGIEFGYSLRRILLDPIWLWLFFILVAGGIITGAALLLLGQTAPDVLSFLAVFSTGYPVVFVFVVARAQSGKRQLRIDRMGLTVHKGRKRLTHAPWNELTSVDIRRIHGMDGVWLVVRPKLGSALLADKGMSTMWAKHDGLPIYNLSHLDGSSERAVRVALAHYSGGRFQADSDAAGIGRER